MLNDNTNYDKLDYPGPGLDGNYFRHIGADFELFSGRLTDYRYFVKNGKVFTTEENHVPVDLQELIKVIVNPIIMAAIFKKYRIRSLVMLELTYKCNLHCLHCYLPNRYGITMQTAFSLDSINSTINTLKKLHVLDISITGGEIFLEPNIILYIRKLSEFFGITILSNATLLTKSTLSELTAIKIQNFRTTIFSHDAEQHDAITGIKGSHSATMRNIGHLAAMDIPFSANIPILTNNISTIKETIDWLNTLAIPYVTDYKIFPSTNLARKHCVEPQFLMDAIKMGYLDPMSYALCTAYYSKLRINSTGDVFPCEYFDTKIGNIFLDDFSEYEIFKNFTNRYGNDLLKRVKCDCSLNSKCFICPAINQLDTGDFRTPSPYICRLNKWTHIDKITELKL